LLSQGKSILVAADGVELACDENEVQAVL
jgi:hypothetical protein